MPGEAAPEAAAPAPTTASEPEPEPESQVGASDAKGWTVFMEKSPFAPQPAAAPTELTAPPAAEPAPASAPAATEPVSGRTVMMDQAPSFQQPAASVPATPAIEVQQQQPPQQPVVAPTTAVATPEPKSNTMLYVGIAIGVVAVIVGLALAFG